MSAVKHQPGGDDPSLRRPRHTYPTALITATVPMREADDSRALVFSAAAKAGMSAAQWAADRLLAAARKELEA